MGVAKFVWHPGYYAKDRIWKFQLFENVIFLISMPSKDVPVRASGVPTKLLTNYVITDRCFGTLSYVKPFPYNGHQLSSGDYNSQKTCAVLTSSFAQRHRARASTTQPEGYLKGLHYFDVYAYGGIYACLKA